MSDTQTWKLSHAACIASGLLALILSVAGFVLSSTAAVSDFSDDQTPVILAWASFPFHALQAIVNGAAMRQFSLSERALQMSIIQKIHKQKVILLTAISVNASLVLANLAFLIAAVAVVGGASAGAIAAGAGVAIVGLVAALVIDGIWIRRLGKDTQLNKAEVFIQPTEYEYQPV